MNIKKIAVTSLATLSVLGALSAPSFAQTATNTAMTQLVSETDKIKEATDVAIPVAVGITAYCAGIMLFKRVIFS